jgi:hypothetical protein
MFDSLAILRFIVAGCALLVACAGVRADDKPLRQVIDTEIRAAWTKQQVTPAARTDDAAFLRRAYLDLVGVIPTNHDALRFLNDTESDKRAKLIDRLLADPRFAAHQADVWDLVMFGRRPSESVRKRDAFKKWVTDKFAKNEPYDRWVRELLIAEQEGSQAFYVQFRNQPEEATVAVSRIFLGTQLQCARCHDHPFERWTQRDFYGMAGFFVRLVVAETGGKMKQFRIGEKSTGDVLFSGAAKDQKPGKKGEPVKPKFLGGSALEEPAVPKDFKEPPLKENVAPPKPAFSRKEKLADWIVARDNPYFARAVANRVWGQFMGRGLVHPVDNLSENNSASHPALLDALSNGLKEHQFDLKWLIREIVSSETYQLASTGAETQALPRWFERGRVRPLTAEELMASLRTASGVSADVIKNDGVEYFMRYFGEPMNGMGDFQGGLSEHLFLNYSPNVRRFTQRTKGTLADRLLTSTDPWEKRVDRLFLTVLGRPPRDEERSRFVKYVTLDPKKADSLVEEAIWALINSSEFRFNH